MLYFQTQSYVFLVWTGYRRSYNMLVAHTLLSYIYRIVNVLAVRLNVRRRMIGDLVNKERLTLNKFLLYDAYRRGDLELQYPLSEKVEIKIQKEGNNKTR